MSATVVSADHLDLLLTAAARYGVLSNPTRAAFTCTTHSGALISPTAAGRLMLEHSICAARSTLGGSDPVLDPELRAYHHVPVFTVDPVEVLKAAHTYEDQAQTSPQWSGSTAAQILQKLTRAAAEHLPGYDCALSQWRRPPVRTGYPVGLRREWEPLSEGIRWVSPRELVAHWDTAAVVVLTVPALPDLPVDLPGRAGVYVVAGSPVSEVEWQQIMAGPSPVLVEFPAGDRWLRDELTAVAAGAAPATLTSAR